MWQYNVPTKCQIHIPYGLRDIPRTRFYRSRSLQQGQRLNQGLTMMLHTSNQYPYQVSTSHTYGFRDIARTKFYRSRSLTMARSKVKSRPHHNFTHLQPQTNVPTKYQLPTPYGFREIARRRFYRSRSLRQGQSSNQGHTMKLHTYNP